MATRWFYNLPTTHKENNNNKRKKKTKKKESKPNKLNIVISIRNSQKKKKGHSFFFHSNWIDQIPFLLTPVITTLCAHEAVHEMLLQNFCHRIASQGAATDLKNTTKWGKTVNRIMFHHPLNVTSCCSSSSATNCVFYRQQSRTRASAASSIIVSFPGRRKEKPKMGPTTLLHNSRLEFTLNNDFHFFSPFLSFFLSFDISIRSHIKRWEIKSWLNFGIARREIVE